MPKRVLDYRQTLQSLTDPIEASHYIQAAREDSNEMFPMALRDVAQAIQVFEAREPAGRAGTE